MPHRYFTRDVADGHAVLQGTDAHHLVHVMRAGIGDEVVLCGPDALEYTGRIESIQGDRVLFTVSEGYPSTAEPRTRVTLYAAYPKQGKLEEVIRHGVELGVAQVVPFFSRYCVAAPKKEEAKNERYNRIAAEAAKQCGRGLVPDVRMPLPDFASVCAEFGQYDLVLFFYEGGGRSLRQIIANTPDAARIALVTGSEGGFAPEEAQQAAASGGVTVGLGPRILRCETAPLAALAAVMTLTGDLE